eukprot:30294-Pelagococcus_subviridis.AAC.22
MPVCPDILERLFCVSSMRRPASFSSGRASSETKGYGGGRNEYSSDDRSGLKLRPGLCGRSTNCATSGGGILYRSLSSASATALAVTRRAPRGRPAAVMTRRRGAVPTDARIWVSPPRGSRRARVGKHLTITPDVDVRASHAAVVLARRRAAM